jgi:asparagine synthase (glutamine-hydrolysing)
MCGIAGYVGKGDKGVLERMTNALAHRGPDDAGFFIQGNIGLGHRRLSIIDTSPAGHQPMQSRDGSVVIVFNGEIYNFQTLRRELEGKGYAFRGGSDTEVILTLYQEYGTHCFSKLNGMFAIGIFDHAAGSVILARDRFGKKPLYWSVMDGTLVFGSELKALFAHPSFVKAIDPASVQKYLAFDYIPTPHTIFKQTYKLEPGHTLVYANGGIANTEFWDVTFGGRKAPLADIVSELDKRLEQAVVSRLVADVPLGVFLSGGLDSSAIAYYAQKNSMRPIRTFSIGFEDKSFDETAEASRVAAFLGTEHFSHRMSARNAMDLIPHIAGFLDEPMADYSVIPTYLLSRFAREQVTVALGGDGGDELFFGYPTFAAEQVFPFVRIMAPALRALERALPVSHAHFNMRFKIHQFLRGIDAPERRRHHAWIGTFAEPEMTDILTPEARLRPHGSDIYEDIDAYWARTAGVPMWHRLEYLYLKTYLMDQVLVKVDRASMAASLEVRAPFLDAAFVDFVNSLDYTQKVHGLTAKYLLKQMMRDKLPAETVRRKKQGFGAPLSAWLAGDLAPFVHETLSRDRIRAGGIFNPDAVDRIVSEHLGRRADHRKKLWSLLVFQMWQDTWL